MDKKLWELNDKNNGKWFEYEGKLYFGKKGLCNVQPVKSLSYVVEQLNKLERGK